MSYIYIYFICHILKSVRTRMLGICLLSWAFLTLFKVQSEFHSRWFIWVGAKRIREATNYKFFCTLDNGLSNLKMLIWLFFSRMVSWRSVLWCFKVSEVNVKTDIRLWNGYTSAEQQDTVWSSSKKTKYPSCGERSLEISWFRSCTSNPNPGDNRT